MDYFQGVVTDYLRANRATFVNTECCIQLNESANPDRSGPHWYCDALAVNMAQREAYLCEISYAKSLDSLSKRLAAWAEHWVKLRVALTRDCGIPADWNARPWAFVPTHLKERLTQQMSTASNVGGPHQMPQPKITVLEDVLPWKYRSWNRPHAPDGDA